jgi:hypothetical protein
MSDVYIYYFTTSEGTDSKRKLRQAETALGTHGRSRVANASKSSICRVPH